MANEKHLTKQDLFEALGGLATKDDVRQIVGEEITARGVATKDDLNKLEATLKDYVRQGVDTVLKAVDELHQEHGQRLEKIETELKTTNRHLLGLDHDTVSKKEFKELKDRVDTHFPLN